MNTKRLKKVVALGMGLSMVGATLFGASAALSGYPSPFVTNGVPKSDLAIIYGDNAKAVDVATGTEIAINLQASAVSKGTSASAGVSLLGDAVQVGSPTDLLELNETLGNVRDTITEFDIGILKGGSISTQRGVTKFNQYLKFNSTAAFTSMKVLFTEDEFDNVGDFFYVRDGHTIFEWVLEFEEGLRSGISGNSSTASLTDLQDRDVNVLGLPYTVVKTEHDTTDGVSANPRTQMILLGGPVYDSLGEGDKKTYTVNGEEYSVEVNVISETNNNVLLSVNGEQLPLMKAGELEPTKDGLLLGVRDIIPTGKDTQSSVVRFYLGASKITLTDNDSTGNGFTTAGMEVNNEVVEDALVQMRTSFQTTGTGPAAITAVVVSDITVRLTSDALVGDMYVPPGHGVREYLDEPEGMLSPNWDLRFEGLSDTGTTTVRLAPVARSEYVLEFTNQEGLKYNLPLMSVRKDGSLRWGDFTSSTQRIAHLTEPHNGFGFFIKPKDYFVVSDIAASNQVAGELVDTASLARDGDGSITEEVGLGFAGSHTDNTAFTRVFRYESYDATNSVATFTDLATGTKQVTTTADGNNNNGTLIAGGNSYAFNIRTGQDNNATFDLNADGTIGNDTAPIVTEGGLLILVNQSNFTQGAGPPAINETYESFELVGADDSGSHTVGQFTDITFTTISKMFDESAGHENLSVRVISRSGGQIGINTTDIFGLNRRATSTGLIFLTSEPEILQGRSDYGALVELFVPLTSNTPEELTIEYPLSQRGANVFITTAGVTSSQLSGASTAASAGINPLQVGVTKLASQVSHVTQLNALVVGGPCANPIAADLLGNPEVCTEGFEAGKAIVKLFTHANGKVALLVAGFSGEDTARAGRALITGRLSGVTGSEAEVSGTSMTDISVKAV